MTEDEELQQMLNGGSNNANGNTGEAPQQQPTTYHADFWTSGELSPEKTPAQPGIDTPNTPVPGTAVSKSLAAASARTAVVTINLTQATLFRPLVNWQFSRKIEKTFGDKLERGLELVDNDETPQDEQEARIKKRLMRMFDERDKKISSIPFNDTEEQDMELAFREYFIQKNVSLGPDIMLYCTLGSTLGKRAIDAFMWG